MDIKILCDCTQKYAFEVEPENGQMPFPIACPSCGADGTANANILIAQQLAPAPAATRIRVTPIGRAPDPVAAEAAAPEAPVAPARHRPAAMESIKEPGTALGYVGGLLGAVLGVALVVGFFKIAGFRFPLLGIAVGVLTGYGARLLYRGASAPLSIFAGALSLISVLLAQFVIYEGFYIMSLVSAVVSASVAYRILTS